MDPRIEAALGEWRFRACDPGYAGLHALADAGFTGGVTTDEAVGLMVNGRLVGMAGGSIESFWGADFSALEADGPALPLLCAMLASPATEEGEYYTGETPISEVHNTLSEGGFTGYIELSENVFSGDYFSIYYGGTSFAAAFLGTEDRIVTGEEARERAGDEVGIFTVHSVDIAVETIPDPEVDDSAGKPVNEEDTTPEPPENDTDDPAAETITQSPDPQEELSNPQGHVDQSRSSEVVRLAESALGADPSTIGGNRRPQSHGSTNEWLAIPALNPSRTGGLEPPTDQSSPTPADKRIPATDSFDEDPPHEKVEEETEHEEAAAENERLRNRVEELESKLAELQSADEETATLTPSAALNGTNLFVRYNTKSNFTLTEALQGNATLDEVMDNLRLEWHTTFETENTTVDGERFGDFLQQTTAYQFSEWLLGVMVFELVKSGEAKEFSRLLEVIPDIDRIEFSGDIPVHSQEGGERQSHTYTFDLVCRNSMGDPVIVADVHESRSPVSGEPVGDLLSEANSIASQRTSLSGAFFVTRSYFEPPALETVADATGGGLLRGSSRQSYVSVSRKHGFHLCLVEARDGTFHLNIPEN